ncbi:ArsR/SmtB family transcription factor [Arsenicicoccus bolidensis]|uniref:ArsR/SmtB family transcription factor n=1 Tax=Arsenicicoccus bolidensis TaxID=229480 RepID=UPI0028B059F3|nr:helix-turn-helix domain-containing protein [Arsenicicoccus bolidensis]
MALREAKRIRVASDLRPSAQVFAALGNVVRLQIVQMLSEHGGMTAAELRVALSAGDISPHLRVLIDAGIVERVGHRKASGAPIIFALVDDALGAIIFLLR